LQQHFLFAGWVSPLWEGRAWLGASEKAGMGWEDGVIARLFALFSVFSRTRSTGIQFGR